MQFPLEEETENRVSVFGHHFAGNVQRNGLSCGDFHRAYSGSEKTSAESETAFRIAGSCVEQRDAQNGFAVFIRQQSGIGERLNDLLHLDFKILQLSAEALCSVFRLEVVRCGGQL